jgi:hypothetical protein
MIVLSREQLLAASDWLPVAPGFGRDASKPFDEGLEPIVTGLRTRHWLGVDVESKGGLENYAHVFIYDSQCYPQWAEDAETKTRTFKGVSIYLSLLGPYAALGPSDQYMSYFKHPVLGKAIGVGGAPYLSLAGVMDNTPTHDTVAQAAFNEVRRHGYQVLTRDNLALQLPPDIEPLDPSGLSAPYTYFDILFNQTD